MNRFSLALVALALPFAAAAQEKKEAGGDKIGKDKAPTVAKKVILEVQKKKGSAISMTGEMSGGGPANAPKITGTFEGAMRKEFAAVKGTLEIYAKGATCLVNTGARFDPPDEIEGQPQQQAHTFKNPSLLINEVSKLVNSATFLGEETIGGRECRELTFVADEATVKQYLKEIGDRLSKQFRNVGGGFGPMINFANALDEKNTIGTYSVMVGKEDLLIYKLDFVIKPKLKPGSLPPQIPKFDLDQRYSVKFSKWDEDVAFEIPAAIKAKWGIK